MLLDLALAADRAECLALAARADIVFDKLCPATLWVSHQRLRAARPGLVVVSLLAVRSALGPPRDLARQ